MAREFLLNRVPKKNGTANGIWRLSSLKRGKRRNNYKNLTPQVKRSYFNQNSDFELEKPGQKRTII